MTIENRPSMHNVLGLNDLALPLLFEISEAGSLRQSESDAIASLPDGASFVIAQLIEAGVITSDDELLALTDEGLNVVSKLEAFLYVESEEDAE